jgi:hypothetical protein
MGVRCFGGSWPKESRRDNGSAITIKNGRIKPTPVNRKPDPILTDSSLKGFRIHPLDVCVMMNRSKCIKHSTGKLLRCNRSVCEVGIRLGNDVSASREQPDASE